MTPARQEAAVLAGASDVTVLDLVDRLLGKGVSICGDLVISVAGVDLVYLSLRALLGAVETAMELDVAPVGEFR